MPHAPEPRPAALWDIPPMDHRAGDKHTAFTWAMGDLILQRIADGETVRAITADARMPAYCTVFRWMQVVPDFGDAVREVRAVLAAIRLAEQSARREANGPPRRSGRRSTYDPAWAGKVVRAIRRGASLSEVVARPGMPSSKAFYRWMRNEPGLAAAYADACRWRDVMLGHERDRVINAVGVDGRTSAASAALRAVDERRGRLKPKLYRTWDLPPPVD